MTCVILRFISVFLKGRTRATTRGTARKPGREVEFRLKSGEVVLGGACAYPALSAWRPEMPWIGRCGTLPTSEHRLHPCSFCIECIEARPTGGTRMIPADPDYETRVRDSFGRQQAMAYLGAQMRGVAPGSVEIVLPFRDELTQQHGFVHAGIITAIVDSACGYAALTLLPAGVGILTVEFKVNLLNPAQGLRFVARGQVVKPGRTLTICTGEVIAERVDGSVRSVALMQATMMTIRERDVIAN